MKPADVAEAIKQALDLDDGTVLEPDLLFERLTVKASEIDATLVLRNPKTHELFSVVVRRM